MTHPFSRTWLAISHVKKATESLVCELHLLRCRLYLNTTALNEGSQFRVGNQTGY